VGASLGQLRGLNLVIAAIVYWNSTYLADAVDHLRKDRGVIPAELLTHALRHLMFKMTGCAIT
jgi:hypothetical protein